jgi:phospholipid/cholesterol/gamma-HCH transport system substrate-binding protein
MPREIGRLRALTNALAVTAVVAVAGFGAAQVARRHWQWQATFRVRADFRSIAGLEPGAKVQVQGIDAGVVEEIVPPSAPGGSVRLVLRIDERLKPLVRSDALARIGTQGVVGAKVLEITPGRPDAPPLGPGETLRTEAPREVAELLKDASTALQKLELVASDAHRGLGEINAIATTIRQGKGSLGKLVRDEEAYEKLVALSTRGERTLNDLEENLAALKRTWPLSRYFDERAFFDRDRVLYHPGAERELQSLAESDLFEPGRAVLTGPGRKRLDEVAAWFTRLRRPKTAEIVIAAFTNDDSRGADLAQALTQEQALAVRKYLVEQHRLDSNGWFQGRRKVAAVGFGTEDPRLPGEGSSSRPPRRVEIIIFTPQA